MYPNAFDYVRPESFAHALELMARHGEEARPLAGGQSLIPLMKLRLASPAVLVDLNALPDLSYFRRQNGHLAFGPLTRHVEVEGSETVGSATPLIADAIGKVGDVQVRNLGTIAGALAEADPAGDWGPVVLALGGEIQCESVEGTRVLDADAFFLDFYTTSLRPDELISEVRLRTPPPGSGACYLKMERRAGDFAVVSAAVQVSLDEDGVCREIGIGLSGIAPTPVKATAAEACLRGQRLNGELVAEAVRLIDGAIDPWSDARAPEEYKREMAGVYFRRALKRACERAGLAASQPV
ncbi:MAG: xanthine dehydrogenase family protein subunit M [Chloroflexi bacterium]|nr:xanthine dehydrogenase family protein subunit M [Chloroflexota bacterium]